MIDLPINLPNGKVIRLDGAIEYRLNGVLHREDGPAMESPDGSKMWCLYGELHREGGPALEDPGNSNSWYINGITVIS